MIQIYYGYGKGKTTAALGSGLRALGAGKKVLFVSFLKDNSSSERFANCDICFYKNPNSIPFLFQMTNDEKQKYALWCKNAVNEAFCANYDVIVLDEFLDVLSLLSDEFVSSMVFSPDKEYIITGHTVNDALFDKADYITRFEKVKHPYDRGVPARKGIEF